MIFLSFANLYVDQRANKENCIYKLKSKDQILSSLIRKA